MIEGLKPYPAVKDSGLPWLGHVPESWEIRRGKFLFRPIDIRSTSGNEELLTVSSQRGIVPRSSANVTMFKAESYVGYKLCWPDDLVINSLWAWARGLGISKHHGIVSSAYGVYRLRPGFEDYAPYIHDLVRSAAFHWELKVRSKGIWISRLQLTDDAFLSAPIPLPPREDVAAIVRFLRHANARIRRYITAKQKLIKLIEEEKRLIIHRAVTRGLHPSTNTRPSGVEWIGTVPAHWEVKKLKQLGEVRIGLTYSPGDITDDQGILVLRASNIKDGRLALEDNVYVSKRVPKNLLVSEGDILICVRSGSRSLVGKSAVITKDFAGVAYGAFMSLLRSKNNPFLYWVLNSQMLPTVMAQFETSTINQLTQSDLRNLVVPLPPDEEQIEIASQLTMDTSKLDTTIDIAHREISLMQEFQTRLIADVVLGKLDVREATAKLPDIGPNAGLLDETDDVPQDEDTAEQDELEAEHAA